VTSLISPLPRCPAGRFIPTTGHTLGLSRLHAGVHSNVGGGYPEDQLSLVSGTIQPFYNSARQTVVPLLVPREDFASAVCVATSLRFSSAALS